MTYQKIFFIAAFLCAGFFTHAQDWSFVKEKDGIKLYTRKEPGDVLKSFKGVTDFYSTVDKVAALISDVNNNKWWGEDISEVKVLNTEGPRHFQYYLVYNLTWPLADRDLVVDARMSTDPATKKCIIDAKSLTGAVPEKQGIVRIRKYWQKWIVQPLDKGIVRVTLEGSADPSGSIPAWIVNSAILDTPYKILKAVRDRTETRQP